MSDTALQPSVARARAEGAPFLHRLHPLAKVIATLPVIVALLFVPGVIAPAAMILVAVALLLAGSRLTARGRLTLVLGVPVSAALLSFGLALWLDPAAFTDTPALITIGGWSLRLGAWWSALATALRLVAIMCVALLGGSTTTGADLVRMMIEQLRVPYRLGYAGLAAFRFAPRFRTEYAVIRRAQHLRGIGLAASPVERLRRWSASLVPLLAAALRHADRVALSMDARGFGYRTARTDRHPLPLRPSDLVFAGAVLAVAAAVIVVGARLG